MIIGVDLTPIQGPHRMRGVGAVVINFINNLSGQERQNNKFVFFTYSDVEDKVEDILDLSGIDYEIRANTTKAIPPLTFPGKLRLVERGLRFASKLPALYKGSSELDLRGIDVYLHTDQMLLMPRAARKVPSAFIAYDVIPYVLQWDYLPSYSVGRRKGWSRKAALRSHFNRQKYRQILRTNSRLAKKALAISEKTKQDFTKYIGTKPGKQSVVMLGVPSESPKELPRPNFERYMPSSWGYIRKPYELDEKVPYILFTGGADSRRKLDELVVAYNCLRAEGHQLSLVLAGDILQGPNNIPIVETQQALQNSSYLDDIVFLGFVDEDTKNWLYQNALTFVYPSKYEGFGLPVLEAMAKGCPVICYKNDAVAEVGGSAALYANNPTDIQDNITMLLNASAEARNKIVKKGITHARQFTWDKTSQAVIDNLRQLT